MGLTWLKIDLECYSTFSGKGLKAIGSIAGMADEYEFGIMESTSLCYGLRSDQKVPPSLWL